MGEIEEMRETTRPRDDSTSSPTSESKPHIHTGPGMHEDEEENLTFWQRVKKPGSVWQIIIAALLAIALGLIITTQVEEVHPAAIAIVGIPGNLWLRALKAVVLPMIVCAMILAIQRLRNMSSGGGKAGKLARWTIGYYVLTTILAVVQATILVGLVWAKLMKPVGKDQLVVDEDDKETIDERKDFAPHDIVVELFESLIPDNIVDALATNSLLAVLVTSVIIGYVIKPRGALMKAVEEVEVIVMRLITILIYMAPIGVFFLILPNLWRLDIEEIGENLGILIGGTLAMMVIHLFIFLPLIVFILTRRNPYAIWIKCSPAWITAWGSASSAATLPVTMRCILKLGVPNAVTKFAAPLGCLINMDGTAIYFPIVVVFLAATQDITLNAADYVIIVLLSTLASIGTTPIPSSSLVLTVMIASSVGIPITGMYAVVVAIDWFLDRFRTAVNVSGDCFASVVVTKMTGITDEDDMEFSEGADPVQHLTNTGPKDVDKVV